MTVGVARVRVVLELPPGGVEGVRHCLVGVLVPGALPGVPGGDDALARHLYVHADVEVLALLLVPGWGQGPRRLRGGRPG